MSFKEIPLMKLSEGTVLFHPYVSKNSFKNVKKVLSGRWIGQGPLVDKFELKFGIMDNGMPFSLMGSTDDPVVLIPIPIILSFLNLGHARA